MFLTSRKKAVLTTIGVILIIGLGILGWQIKGGKLFSRADTLANGQTFSDVPMTYWAYLQIEAAFRGGIVSGYPDGSFKPDQVVTRDQVAVFISRAVAGGDSKVPAGPATPSFADVPTSHWAFKYIEYCKTKGIVSAAANYNPTGVVNRDAMAVYLARAVAGSDANVPAAPSTATFKDVPTNNWAYKYIEYLASQNIAKGYADGTYHPTEAVTRAQMAVFVTNGFDLISTALVANISGKVTSSTGAPLANGYLVIDEGDDITQIDANGNYALSGLDSTTYEVYIYDANGNQYEAPDISNHLISPNYGNNTINFSGLVKK